MSTPESPRRRHSHRAHRRQKALGPRLVVGLIVLAVLGAVAGYLVSSSGGNSPAASQPPTPSTPATSTTQPQDAATTTAPSTTTTTIATVPPSSVSVEVLNGDGIKGKAAEVATALQAIGFRIIGTTDASSFAHNDNVVAYRPGNESVAEVVANHIAGATQLMADPSITGSAVELVVGSDYAGVTNT